jgi:hypothetical protein
MTPIIFNCSKKEYLIIKWIINYKAKLRHVIVKLPDLSYCKKHPVLKLQTKILRKIQLKNKTVFAKDPADLITIKKFIKRHYKMLLSMGYDIHKDLIEK